MLKLPSSLSHEKKEEGNEIDVHSVGDLQENFFLLEGEIDFEVEFLEEEKLRRKVVCLRLIGLG